MLCASVAAGALEMAHHALAALGPDGGLLSAAAAHSSGASDEWPLLTTLQLLELLASSPALGPAEGNALHELDQLSDHVTYSLTLYELPCKGIYKSTALARIIIRHIYVTTTYICRKQVILVSGVEQGISNKGDMSICVRRSSSQTWLP